MSTVYAKTPKGQSELESRAGGLKPKTRRILILINGRNDLDEVTRLSLHDEATVTEAIRQLLNEGYIDLAGQENKAAPPLPMPATPIVDSEDEFAPLPAGPAPGAKAVPPPSAPPVVEPSKKTGPNTGPIDPFGGMIKF